MYTHDPYNGRGRLPGMYHKDSTFQKVLDSLLLTVFTHCGMEISYFEWIIKQMEEYGSYLFFLVGQPDRHYKSNTMRSIIRILYKLNLEFMKRTKHTLTQSLYSNKTVADNIRYLRNELRWSLSLLFENRHTHEHEREGLVRDILLDGKATYSDLYKYYTQITDRQMLISSPDSRIYKIDNINYKKNPLTGENIFFMRHQYDNKTYIFWNYKGNTIELSSIWSVNIRNPDVIFYKESQNEKWEKTFDNYLFIPKSFYRSIVRIE